MTLLTRLRPLASLVLLLALASTACGDAEQLDPTAPEASSAAAPAPSAAPGSSGTAATEASLTVVLTDAPGTDPDTFDLVCGADGSVGGSHPDPAAACAQLATADDAFAPVAQDTICTQQFGGEQTADVTGTLGGNPVQASFSRTDGCQISRWDSLDELLGSVF